MNYIKVFFHGLKFLYYNPNAVKDPSSLNKALVPIKISLVDLVFQLYFSTYYLDSKAGKTYAMKFETSVTDHLELTFASQSAGANSVIQIGKLY